MTSVRARHVKVAAGIAYDGLAHSGAQVLDCQGSVDDHGAGLVGDGAVDGPAGDLALNRTGKQQAQ